MSYMGLDPPRVRDLARALRTAANASSDLVAEARSALFTADLTSTAPGYLAGLASAIDSAGTVLAGRADTADRFVIDRQLVGALLDVAAAVAAVVPLPDCSLGPPTAIGAASPCDPVVGVKIYELGAGVKLPFKLLSLTLTRDHAYRVEYLTSGKIRVTRIDGFAAGVGPSVGGTAAVAGGTGLRATLARSVDANARLLFRAADSYEIAEADLPKFILDDLLEEAALAGGPAPLIRPLGPIRWLAASVARVADALPLGPVHSLVTDVRRALGWTRPEPVSTSVEAGGGVHAEAALKELLARLGLSIDVTTVAGVVQQENVTTVYVKLTGEVAGQVALGTFGRQAGEIAAVQVGLVVANTGRLARLEVTSLTIGATSATRTTQAIDLSRLDLVPGWSDLWPALADPRLVTRKLDELRELARGRITVNESTFDLTGATVQRLELQGNGVSFDVTAFRAR